MALVSFLWTWYNLPFVASLGGCLLLGLIQLIGGLGDGDADGDADLDGDAELDADGGVFDGALEAIGVGRAPLTIVLMALLGSFGLLGLLGNTVVTNLLGRYPDAALPAVLLLSLVLGLLMTGRISRLFARIAPDTSAAISFEQLIGRVGVVVSPSISPTYGRVQVRDSFGSLHTVFAVIDGGAPLPERSEVALLAYDSPRRCFVVKPIGVR